jgi:NADH:ubiquinone oxidoreductase subunit F (NADH-binding)
LKLIQTGGPLGGVLGADQLDISLDFEAMAQAGAILGSGGIIAADEKTCAVDLTRSILAFCQYESCGKCFPCRLGMTHILEILEKICSFQGEMADLDVLHEVGQRMQSGSLCGHGQLGFNPVTSALKYFEYEFQSHIISKDCPTDQCTLNRYSPKTNRR